MRLALLTLLAATAMTGCPVVDTVEILAERLPASGSGGGVLLDVSFELDVLPMLEETCWECHTGTSPPAGVDLSSYETILDSGVVEPGRPESSPLYTMVRDGMMPPPGREPLSDAEVQWIGDWIEAGAPNN